MVRCNGVAMSFCELGMWCPCLLLTMAMAFLLCASSCKMPTYAYGTTEAEFKKHNHNAVLVEMNEHVTVYRITLTMLTTNPGSKFYYFRDGKLFSIDEGERQPDVVVEHKN